MILKIACVQSDIIARNPSENFKHLDEVFKKIQDEIALVLSTTDLHRNTLHESLYLLILAKELGNAYLLVPEVIKSFIEKNDSSQNIISSDVRLLENIEPEK